MVKKIIIIALLFYGVRYVWDFGFSPEFQEYADQHKYPWTCKLDLAIAGVYMIGSDFDFATNRMQPILKRCPGTEMSMVAEFRIAECIQKSRRYSEAIKAFEKFAKKYPNTKIGSKALKRIRYLRTAI